VGGEQTLEINRAKIMIAGDHRLMAEGCRKLLEPEFEVVATVGDGRTLVRLAATLKPKLIIIDIGMPLLNGLDAAYQVKQLLPSVKLLFVTMNTDPAVAAEAFRCGASGYLLKTCAASELIVAVREVLKGRSYLCTAITKETVDVLLQQGKKPFDQGQRLSERQREVLQLLSEGKSMKEAAYVLNIKMSTVAFHKLQIKKILDTKNNAELVQYAIRNYMIAGGNQAEIPQRLNGQAKRHGESQMLN